MQMEGRMDRRTDMTKLIVALRNFANAPKNDLPRLNKNLNVTYRIQKEVGFTNLAEF